MEIRPAYREDLPTIAAIQVASWRDAYSGLLPAEYLASEVQLDLEAHWAQQQILPQDVVLVADTTGGPVGFVAVWCRPSAFIDNLHVLPPLRSRGIGATLMRAAAARLVALGHSTAYLWVFERNEAAIRLYERLGAVQTRRESKTFFGQGVPSVCMEWRDLTTIGRPLPSV